MSRLFSKNKRNRRTRSALQLESLEQKQLMAADFFADNDLAHLSDEFDDANTISQWQRVHEVENWNADQLETWDINQSEAGKMVMQPHTAVWYQNWRGPMAFKEVTGDFVITTEVTIGDRDDLGDSDLDDLPDDAQFSLGGIMIRTPREIADPNVDWAPGTMADDGTNQGENYVFLSLGHANDQDHFSLEVKTTRNSDSQLQLTDVGEASTAELQIAKIGNSVITLYRLPGESWQVHERYTRNDMPDTLQVGLVSYTNWEKAGDFDPFVHNSNVLIEGQVADPSPGESFDPDLTASYEYARYQRPNLPDSLTGIDLVNSATHQQLLSFLGDNLNAEPTPGNQAPTLAAIDDQSMSRLADELLVAFEASDPDGDPLSVNVEVVQSELYQLDQAYQLTSGGNYYDNWGGLNERWINDNSGAWFYLLPSSELYQWGGNFESSSLIAQLDPEVYDDPSLLTDATSLPVSVAIDGNQVVIDPASDFVGSFEIRLSATDGQATTERLFQVEVINNELLLDTIDPILLQSGGDPSLVLLNAASNPEVPVISYSAQLVGSTAQQIDEEYDLNPAANHYTNWGGQQEKWLQATDYSWFFILPDGGFYRWQGSFASSELLETFDSSFYENPNLIAEPEALPVNLLLDQNELLIEPDANFVGQFQIEVAATDGFNVSTQLIDVSVDPVLDEPQPKPVLMVIANQDFYYQEYGDTRSSLEAQGLDVVVAATTTEVAQPHANSGQGNSDGHVTPDIALADASAADYSSIVFVGGWGSSMYQYDFPGDYNNPVYNGSLTTKQAVNDLINDFVAQEKYVTAICHGVSVLAWARVDGGSLLAGQTVSAWANTAPASNTELETTRQHIELNGAVMVQSGSVGDPTTVADDVIVDGNIITAENYDSAAAFGDVIGELVSQQSYIEHVDQIFADWD